MVAFSFLSPTWRSRKRCAAALIMPLSNTSLMSKGSGGISSTAIDRPSDLPFLSLGMGVT